MKKRTKNSIGNTLRKGSLKSLLNESLTAYYWIGFILADGWISHKTGQLVVGISEKDKDHLKKLALFLNTESHLIREEKDTDFFGASYKCKPKYRVAVQDPNVTMRIIKKFGFLSQKTFNPPKMDFNKMTKNKFLSFFTGYVDGDFNISLAKHRKGFRNCIRVECHKNYIPFLNILEQELYKRLKFTLLRSHVYKNKKGFAMWYISKQLLIRKLKNLVNNLNIPVLERKWDNVYQGGHML
jgi:hypothetical protein